MGKEAVQEWEATDEVLFRLVKGYMTSYYREEGRATESGCYSSDEAFVSLHSAYALTL